LAKLEVTARLALKDEYVPALHSTNAAAERLVRARTAARARIVLFGCILVEHANTVRYAAIFNLNQRSRSICNDKIVGALNILNDIYDATGLISRGPERTLL
jgi:hypothetical protein